MGGTAEKILGSVELVDVDVDSAVVEVVVEVDEDDDTERLGRSVAAAADESLLGADGERAAVALGVDEVVAVAPEAVNDEASESVKGDSRDLELEEARICLLSVLRCSQGYKHKGERERSAGDRGEYGRRRAP